jgi:hypothetical protein
MCSLVAFWGVCGPRGVTPLKIPEWEWEEIGMDFITGLPRTSKGYDSVWVIEDRWTKVAHSFPSRLLIKVLN